MKRLIWFLRLLWIAWRFTRRPSHERGEALAIVRGMRLTAETFVSENGPLHDYANGHAMRGRVLWDVERMLDPAARRNILGANPPEDDE